MNIKHQVIIEAFLCRKCFKLDSLKWINNFHRFCSKRKFNHRPIGQSLSKFWSCRTKCNFDGKLYQWGCTRLCTWPKYLTLITMGGRNNHPLLENCYFSINKHQVDLRPVCKLKFVRSRQVKKRALSLSWSNKYVFILQNMEKTTEFLFCDTLYYRIQSVNKKWGIQRLFYNHGRQFWE